MENKLKLHEILAADWAMLGNYVLQLYRTVQY